MSERERLLLMALVWALAWALHNANEVTRLTEAAR